MIKVPPAAIGLRGIGVHGSKVGMDRLLKGEDDL